MRFVRAGVVLAAAGCVALLATAGCGKSSGDAKGRLRVVATTTQVADFARDVGGSRVVVHQILKPNVDPHDYEPSPADIEAIRKADLLVKNGVGLEKWLDKSISSAGFHGAVVDASKGVKVRRGNGEEEEAAGDPHIWHNPLNAKVMASDIEAGLAKADSRHAAEYQHRLSAYQAKLDALDADIARRIDTIPPGQRKLVTNHDAFGYYVDRYHLEFVGSIIPSFDTSAEMSAKDVNDLVARIRATGTKAIFSESSLPPKTARTIANEAGVKVEAGENSLYGDTLGPKGSAGDTYPHMEEHNTKVIVAALGGSSG
jgi:ABC-type Zn uptake system ZnuABC Zn-binding protein ZnuA